MPNLYHEWSVDHICRHCGMPEPENLEDEGWSNVHSLQECPTRLRDFFRIKEDTRDVLIKSFSERESKISGIKCLRKYIYGDDGLKRCKDLIDNVFLGNQVQIRVMEVDVFRKEMSDLGFGIEVQEDPPMPVDAKRIVSAILRHDQLARQVFLLLQERFNT